MAETLFERFHKQQKGLIKTPPCEGWRNSQDDAPGTHPSRVMYKYRERWYCYRCLVDLFELNAFNTRKPVAKNSEGVVIESIMSAPPTFEQILAAYPEQITVWPPSEQIKRDKALKAA